MADYCTIDDVRLYLGTTRIDDQSENPPDASQVETIIATKTGEINVALVQGGLTLPVSPGSDLLAKLKGLEAREVAYEVFAIRNTNEKDDPLMLGWHEEYIAFLIAAATAEEPIATTPGAVGPSSFTMNATDALDDPLSAHFRKDQARNW